VSGENRRREVEQALSSQAEEVLERMYVELEKREASPETWLEIDDVVADEDERSAVGDLETRGLVSTGHGRVRLTPPGHAAASRVIRRHRLAERLLVDVLDVGGDIMDQTACAFEHVLKPGVEEKVCTLLGHPRFCPHNLPIPPGKCCEDRKRETVRAVAPLSELNPGQAGVIAYVHSSDSTKLAKLMAMGVLPGERIRLLRRLPSYVFEVGFTQYAVDRDVAADVYVRIESAEPGAPGRGRWRWGRRR
jgi:DtxR family Mn-dependent transcriptional regulator